MKPAIAFPREPVPATKRKAATPKQRAELFLNFQGKCASCGGRLQPGWHLDHVIPLAFGGAHSPENWQPLCAAKCHKSKTRIDNILAKKGRRIRGESKAQPQRKLQSRAFDKTKSKRFDGSVVERRA